MRTLHKLTTHIELTAPVKPDLVWVNLQNPKSKIQNPKSKIQNGITPDEPLQFLLQSALALEK